MNSLRTPAGVSSRQSSSKARSVTGWCTRVISSLPAAAAAVLSPSALSGGRCAEQSWPEAAAPQRHGQAEARERLRHRPVVGGSIAVAADDGLLAFHSPAPTGPGLASRWSGPTSTTHDSFPSRVRRSSGQLKQDGASVEASVAEVAQQCPSVGLEHADLDLGMPFRKRLEERGHEPRRRSGCDPAACCPRCPTRGPGRRHAPRRQRRGPCARARGDLAGGGELRSRKSQCGDRGRTAGAGRG
jgi:hypothetical protein